MQEKRKISKKTIVWILGSFFSIVLVFFIAKILWEKQIEKSCKNPFYNAAFICQTSPQKGLLRSDYFAEVLGLSQDFPVSLYQLDCKECEKKLLASPLIQKVKVKKRFPNTLYIDYEVRRPIAKIADYRNTAIDKEGYLFPLSPFLSVKEIPEIYLGLPAFGAMEDSFGRKGGKWNEPLKDRYIQLAFDLLVFLKDAPWKEGLKIKKIDVSNAFATTLGTKEIVITTEEELIFGEGKVALFPKLLRLSPKDYPQQISSFFLLRRHMENDYRKQIAHLKDSTRFSPRIIDLRIPHLAFVENGQK